MKKRSKVMLTALCAVLLVVGSVFGTIAYFTDSEVVTNTFTVGKVDISMDEADTDDSTADADRDTANKYHLIPGQTYVKDPTIHVAADSEACYLFVKVENGIKAIETEEQGKSVAEQMAALDWYLIDEANGIYALGKGKDDAEKAKYTVSGGAEVVVFNSFTIDGDKVVNVEEGETVETGEFDLSDYATAEIKVTAYAVQAAGFDTAQAAWDATFKTT